MLLFACLSLCAAVTRDIDCAGNFAARDVRVCVCVGVPIKVQCMYCVWLPAEEAYIQHNVTCVESDVRIFSFKQLAHCLFALHQCGVS